MVQIQQQKQISKPYFECDMAGSFLKSSVSTAYTVKHTANSQSSKFLVPTTHINSTVNTIYCHSNFFTTSLQIFLLNVFSAYYLQTKLTNKNKYSLPKYLMTNLLCILVKKYDLIILHVISLKINGNSFNSCIEHVETTATQ